MQQQLIQSIVEEVSIQASGRFLGKIFQLSPLSFALDLGLRGSFLLISADPSSPRFYLIERRVKDLEKQSIPLALFGQSLRSRISGGQLVEVYKEQSERIVRLTFRIEDELGRLHFRRLVAQLTGRTANLFMLDELNRITLALRNPKGLGQQPGDLYLPPASSGKPESPSTGPRVVGSPSSVANAHFAALDEKKAFAALVNAARSKLKQALQQKLKLKANLQQDLTSHGDPEKHKRIGDLLLANIGTAIRKGNQVQLTDYYSEGAPVIELEVDENSSLQEEAARQFRQYTKAKRANEEINLRLVKLESELAQLENRRQEIEQLIEQRDEAALSEFSGKPPAATSGKTKSSTPAIPGVRRYLSTDGYEILVGRAARDNDNLTFRVARPHDMWMHAGDYPGSHVVIRNPTRKEIPQRTIIEAAQLAGRFSQASEDSKVVVHYTERKFLSKPKGSAPGLVRLSSFRSITVEPREGIPRL